MKSSLADTIAMSLLRFSFFVKVFKP